MLDLTAIAISLLLALNFQLDVVHSAITFGKISPGFRGNNFNWIDDNGVFLSSVNRTFTLGLVNQPSEGTESDYYLVITHRPSSTIIWTANRDSPVSSSDYFAFSSDGEANLTSSEGGCVWRTNTKRLGVTSMELQESGNLVLLNSTDGVAWQSFDYPTDTLVSGQVLRPGMRLVSRVATTSGTNLSSGRYALQMQQGDLSLLAEFQPVQKYWSLQSSGQRTKLTEESPETAVLTNSGWVFYGRSGLPALKILFPGGHLPSSSMVFATITSDGSVSFGITDSTSSSSDLLTMLLSIPAEFCDRPSPCGPYSVCSTNEVCSCPQALSTLYGASCSPPQSSSSNCRSSPSPASFYRVGGGLTYFGIKFQSPEKVSGFDDCKNLCQTNCSCNALFFQSTTNSCYIWGQMGSLQLATTKDSFDLYVRSSTPVPTDNGEARNPKNSLLIPIVAASVVFCVGISVLAFFLLICKTRKKCDEARWSSSDEAEDIDELVPGMPRRFNFRELQLATDNFKNVVGRGGFGFVYEGWLPDGRRIAVKQLQKIGEGRKQFQAEVATIGSIHHLHLTRLKGFCAEGKQRLLVYDFMPNGSLDKFLFKKPTAGAASDGTPAGLLDWKKRFGIAVGTAKGLAYLHEECAVKIIHCDVKPENILLDANFSPKISDFGLAKLLSREDSQALTTMRGTRGYLAPEWLTTSVVSTKSDIYSYGMVLLELVGGRKNLDPSVKSSEKCYLPVYAYQMQAEGRVAEVVDELLGGEFDEEEVERCIKVAMWCVQENWNLRPTMGTVVKMLTGSLEMPPLPPTPPTGFRLHLSMLKGEVSSLSGSREEKTASTTTTTNDTLENADHGVLSSYELSGPR